MELPKTTSALTKPNGCRRNPIRPPQCRRSRPQIQAVLPASRRHDKVLLAIAVFKYVKMFAFNRHRIGALRLLHHEVPQHTVDWVRRVVAEPQHQALHQVLSHACTSTVITCEK